VSASLAVSVGSAWLFAPGALALGALHGLEPGHSKTLMAAFIVAVRGTVAQAVLLGLAATLSHTAVVWLLALLGLYLGGHLDVARVEPYFLLLSALLMVALALWMARRTWQAQHQHAAHGPSCGHDHAHAIQHAVTPQPVGNGQIILFGLTGGLLPCPASLTVLLLCLQLKKYSLGLGLVLCFSLGLALTLVASGALAALGVRQVARRWSGLEAIARRAPYASSGVLLILGVYSAVAGFRALF